MGPTTRNVELVDVWKMKSQFINTFHLLKMDKEGVLSPGRIKFQFFIVQVVIWQYVRPWGIWGRAYLVKEVIAILWPGSCRWSSMNAVGSACLVALAFPWKSMEGNTCYVNNSSSHGFVGSSHTFICKINLQVR